MIAAPLCASATQPNLFPVLGGAPSAAADSVLVRCARARVPAATAAAGTECNPAGLEARAEPFPCADGYRPSSLLCSRCAEGFTDAGGGVCVRCVGGMDWLVPTVPSLFYAAAAVAALAVNPRRAEVTEWAAGNPNWYRNSLGRVQIVAHWMQLMHALREVGVLAVPAGAFPAAGGGGGGSGPSQFGGAGVDTAVAWAGSLASLEPFGLSCRHEWWHFGHTFFAVVLLPPLLLAAVLLVYLAGRAVARAAPRPFFRTWGTRCTHTAQLLLSLLYFRYVLTLARSWSCFRGPDGSGLHALRAAPHLECAEPGMLIVSVAGFLAFGLGLPAYLDHQLAAVREMQHDALAEEARSRRAAAASSGGGGGGGGAGGGGGRQSSADELTDDVYGGRPLRQGARARPSSSVSHARARGPSDLESATGAYAVRGSSSAAAGTALPYLHAEAFRAMPGRVFFLFAHLRWQVNWWDSRVTAARRLVLALLLGAVPAESAFLPVLVLAVLLASVVATATYRPYVSWLDHWLEVSLSIVAAAAVLAGVSAASGTADVSDRRALMVAIWCVVLVAFCASLTAVVGFRSGHVLVVLSGGVCCPTARAFVAFPSAAGRKRAQSGGGGGGGFTGKKRARSRSRNRGRPLGGGRTPAEVRAGAAPAAEVPVEMLPVGASAVAGAAAAARDYSATSGTDDTGTDVRTGGGYSGASGNSSPVSRRRRQKERQQYDHEREIFDIGRMQRRSRGGTSGASEPEDEQDAPTSQARRHRRTPSYVEEWKRREMLRLDLSKPQESGELHGTAHSEVGDVDPAALAAAGSLGRSSTAPRSRSVRFGGGRRMMADDDFEEPEEEAAAAAAARPSSAANAAAAAEHSESASPTRSAVRTSYSRPGKRAPRSRPHSGGLPESHRRPATTGSAATRPRSRTPVSHSVYSGKHTASSKKKAVSALNDRDFDTGRPLSRVERARRQARAKRH